MFHNHDLSKRFVSNAAKNIPFLSRNIDFARSIVYGACESEPLDAVYGGGVGANIKALRKRVRVHFLPLLINPFDHQRTRSRFHQRYSLTCPRFARAF